MGLPTTDEALGYLNQGKDALYGFWQGTVKPTASGFYTQYISDIDTMLSIKDISEPRTPTEEELTSLGEGGKQRFEHRLARLQEIAKGIEANPGSWVTTPENRHIQSLLLTPNGRASVAYLITYNEGKGDGMLDKLGYYLDALEKGSPERKTLAERYPGLSDTMIIGTVIDIIDWVTTAAHALLNWGKIPENAAIARAETLEQTIAKNLKESGLPAEIADALARDTFNDNVAVAGYANAKKETLAIHLQPQSTQVATAENAGHTTDASSAAPPPPAPPPPSTPAGQGSSTAPSGEIQGPPPPPSPAPPAPPPSPAPVLSGGYLLASVTRAGGYGTLMAAAVGAGNAGEILTGLAQNRGADGAGLAGETIQENRTRLTTYELTYLINLGAHQSNIPETFGNPVYKAYFGKVQAESPSKAPEQIQEMILDRIKRANGAARGSRENALKILKVDRAADFADRSLVDRWLAGEALEKVSPFDPQLYSTYRSMIPAEVFSPTHAELLLDAKHLGPITQAKALELTKTGKSLEDALAQTAKEIENASRTFFRDKENVVATDFARYGQKDIDALKAQALSDASPTTFSTESYATGTVAAVRNEFTAGELYYNESLRHALKDNGNLNADQRAIIEGIEKSIAAGSKLSDDKALTGIVRLDKEGMKKIGLNEQQIDALRTTKFAAENLQKYTVAEVRRLLEVNSVRLDGYNEDDIRAELDNVMKAEKAGGLPNAKETETLFPNTHFPNILIDPLGTSNGGSAIDQSFQLIISGGSTKDFYSQLDNAAKAEEAAKRAKQLDAQLRDQSAYYEKLKAMWGKAWAEPAASINSPAVAGELPSPPTPSPPAPSSPGTLPKL